jgi:peptidoglycan/LPS O-acetylase OafA/YrhL
VDPRVRDTSFALYFTLAFGVGSLWTAFYGQLTRPELLGEAAGLPIVFVIMAVSFVLAALSVLPIREPARRMTAPAVEPLP